MEQIIDQILNNVIMRVTAWLNSHKPENLHEIFTYIVTSSITDKQISSSEKLRGILTLCSEELLCNVYENCLKDRGCDSVVEMFTEIIMEKGITAPWGVALISEYLESE